MKFFPLFILTIVLVSCTLNADQEASLNQHVSKYLKARNGCMVVGLVGFSHPEYIRELKNESDSVLLQTFDCSEFYEKGIHYTDPTLRKTKKSGNTIHIYYELDIENKSTGKTDRRAQGLYAISEDNGKSWFFLDKKIYDDKESCKSLKRLLE